jgi:hypothetical protein
MQSGAYRGSIRQERRKQKRTKAAENAFASVRNDHGAVGNIMDMSFDGLCFKYISDTAAPAGVLELDIFLSGHVFLLSRIPCRSIADVELACNFPFSTVSMRRRSVQFLHLTQTQRSMIEHLIRYYTESPPSLSG